MRWSRQSDASNEIRADMRSLIEAMPEYSKNQALLDEVFEKAHNEAFGVAYSSGRRRDRFDESAYYNSFFATMVYEVNLQKAKGLERALKDLQAKVAGKVNTP